MRSVVALLALCLSTLSAQNAKIGPPKGHLVVVGGGTLGPEIVNRFIELAGGKNARFVFIPTAGEEQSYDAKFLDRQFLAKAGVKNVTLLHTRDRKEADTKAFAEPLKTATGVWFSGGRQWRLVDSYLNTRTHREILNVLKRGGVVGGSSAGATIQGSYLVRGAREGNTIMMAPGYEVGMALLKNVAVDQHLLVRKRQDDMVQVIQRHKQLLGIGIDESTAIVVTGDEFQVIGKSKVAIYDPKRPPESNAKHYFFLNAGDRFDLAHRQVLNGAASDR